MSHGHLPRHDWCVVVVDLCSLHFRQLLWNDRAIGRYGHLCCWDVLGGLGLGVHELLCWPVSSKRCLDELHELPHGQLPRHDWSVFVGNLRSLHCRELLRHNGALGSHCDMCRRAVLGRLCIGLHELLCWPVSSKHCVDELHELPHQHLPRHDRSVVVGDLRSLHCRKLLRHDWALGSNCGMRHRAVLHSFGLCLH